MNEYVLKAEGVFSWYVPNTSNEEIKHVAGTLEIADNGIATLSLVGVLPDEPFAGGTLKSSPVKSKRCVFGVLKDSRYVFLRQIGSGGTTFSNTLSHQTLKARESLVFHDLKNFPDLDVVTNLMIRLDALGEWASESAVEIRKTQRGITARASKLKTQEFRLPGKTVYLKTDLRYTAPVGFWHQSVSIRQETFLEIKPKVPFSLDSAREEFRLLEDLLLLLADVDVSLPWPTVKYGNEIGLYYFERRRSDPQKVEIMKSWAALKWPALSLGSLLSNLKDQQEILGPGLYLYLGIRRAPSLYLENKFSTAVFGLESLHRRVGLSVTQVRLEEKIARIIRDVELQKDREWLSGRLKNASEPNLEERLFLTFSEIDIGLEKKQLRAFAKECADVRNQIAHFGGQRDGDYGLFVQRMHVLNEAVRPLYHAVLLNRIGLDSSRIWAYFYKSPYSPERRSVLSAAGLSFAPSSVHSPKVPIRSKPVQEL